MTTEHSERLREAALGTLQPEEFDRLVSSVAGTRRLGRLRYWQEQLLARITIGAVSVAEYVSAFDGAPLQKTRITPAEAARIGFVDAWRRNQAWRDDFVSDAARELSKHGDLGCHAHVFRELAGGLRRDEVLRLFARFQQSLRATLEWRDEFLALFPQVSLADLPPPLYDEEAAVRWAAGRRAAAQREQAEAEAECIRRRGTLPDPDDIPF